MPFFSLISERYLRSGTILTSNKGIADWGDVLGDHAVASAIVDRMLHHCHTITIKGSSYRLKEKRRAGLIAPVSAPVVDKDQILADDS